jgi:hypothetical protein
LIGIFDERTNDNARHKGTHNSAEFAIGIKLSFFDENSLFQSLHSLFRLNNSLFFFLGNLPVTLCEGAAIHGFLAPDFINLQFSLFFSLLPGNSGFRLGKRRHLPETVISGNKPT